MSLLEVVIGLLLVVKIYVLEFVIGILLVVTMALLVVVCVEEEVMVSCLIIVAIFLVVRLCLLHRLLHRSVKQHLLQVELLRYIFEDDRFPMTGKPSPFERASHTFSKYKHNEGSNKSKRFTIF